MGQKISAPVWVDGTGHLLLGELVGVDSESVVVGSVPQPIGYSTPPYPAENKPTLFIKDPNLGGLYLDWTLAQWQAAVRGSSQSPAPTEMTKYYDIVTDQSTITDPALLGATLLSVWKNGVELDFRGMLSGTTLTFANPLGDGDTVAVTYFVS